MVEYLSGNRIQGSSTLSSSPPQTSWKEIGRFKLSSASDTITVKGLANATSGTLADKDNIMILGHTINSGNTNVFFRCNGDNQQKYAENGQINGGTNYTQDDQTQLDLSGGAESKPMFIVQNIVNIPTQEKLIISNTNNCATGASNTPNRIELVGKWESPSNTAIQSVSFNNTSSGDYATDSEIVVLGCDNDEANSGTNFWQELADVELSEAINTIDTGTFTAKKYLYLEFYSIPSGSESYSVLRFNLDENNNYSSRYSTNGGTDASHGGNNYILFYAPLNASERFMSAFIVNKSDKEKLVIGEGVSQNTAGAGNIPERRELYGKWANTSSSITSIQIHSDADDDNPSRKLDSGTRLKVWGSD